MAGITVFVCSAVFLFLYLIYNAEAVSAGTRVTAAKVPSGAFEEGTSSTISPGNCEEECKENEEFSNCTQRVDRPINCCEKGQPPKSAIKISDAECKSGCICQAGYLRAPSGACISEDQCYGDLVCSDNEIANTCPGKCNDNCPTSPCDNDNSCNGFQKSTECGEPKCTCRFNTRRNADGKCVSIPDCPPFDCPQPNEIYDPCYGSCTSENCSDVFRPCPPFRILIVVECKPNCKCLSGYSRDNGICIPTSKCPGICPQNEMYSYCSNALCRPQNCSQKDQKLACPSVTSCEDGCVCVEGTLRDENGVCVPENECSAAESCCCGVNEQPETDLKNCIDCVPRKGCKTQCGCLPGYERDCNGLCLPCEDVSVCSCGVNEQPETDLKNCIDCVPRKGCQTQCGCLPGYKRNDKGLCLPCQDVSVCSCGVNEQPETDLKNCIDCVPRKGCQTQCGCLPGYERNDKGMCLPCQDVGACRCGVNEQPETDLKNCIDCVPRKGCQTQCGCLPGYERNDKGLCLPCKEPPNCGPNAEAVCVKQCPPERTCRNKFIKFSCLSPEGEKCQQKCVCKKDYYRNAIGECITGDQCDQCNKDHEFFSCGQECDNECVREDQNRTSCPIINVVCNPKCYCEDGFARDCNGTCVPIDCCPKIEKCHGKNEIFGCKNICPPSEMCFSIVARFKCGEDVANKKTPECTCKPGYYRQKEGSPCIPFCKCKEVRNTLECAGQKATEE